MAAGSLEEEDSAYGGSCPEDSPNMQLVSRIVDYIPRQADYSAEYSTASSLIGTKEINCCPECDMPFPSKGNLALHMRTHDCLSKSEYLREPSLSPSRCDSKSNNNNNNNGKSNHRPFICSKCNFNLPSRSALNSHMKSHSNEKPFVCVKCQYTCKYEGSLKRHMRKHEGLKPFACHLCSYRCLDKSAIVTHIKRHDKDNKEFRCTHCDYATHFRSQLNIHLRKHTGLKPYSCDFCNYTCARKSVLVMHVRVHTGERPFQCDHCPYAATQRQALVKHKRTQHSKRGVTFSSMTPVKAIASQTNNLSSGIAVNIQVTSNNNSQIYRTDLKNSCLIYSTPETRPQKREIVPMENIQMNIAGVAVQGQLSPNSNMSSATSNDNERDPMMSSTNHHKLMSDDLSSLLGQVNANIADEDSTSQSNQISKDSAPFQNQFAENGLLTEIDKMLTTNSSSLISDPLEDILSCASINDKMLGQLSYPKPYGPNLTQSAGLQSNTSAFQTPVQVQHKYANLTANLSPTFTQVLPQHQHKYPMQEKCNMCPANNGPITNIFLGTPPLARVHNLAIPQCWICGQRFPNSYDLSMHQVQFHPSQSNSQFALY